MRSRALPHVLFFSLPLLVACGGGTPTPTTPNAPATPKDLSGAATAKGPEKPESDKVTWKRDPSPKSCHTGDKGTGDLVAGVTAMAKACADKLHQVGTPTTGQSTGASGDMVKTIPLKAQANHCYRVFGLAEASVSDLDIAVMDSAGKSAGEDSTDSNDSVVLEDGAICFNADDDAKVNVAVANGTGKWAVEVWSD